MGHHNISRRKFLGQASCAGLGYTTLLSTLVNLKSINAASILNSTTIDCGGYKAMVCLLLEGGADSFNMLIPRGDSEWQQYATTRSNNAIPQNDILSINPTESVGKDLGVHPAMSNMRDMFNNGEMAFISNIGSLINGVSKDDIYSGTADLPLGLFSHADQVMHWQTGVPQDRVAQGWGGKIADMMYACNSNQNISLNVSLGGSNLFQTGNQSIEFSIDPYNGSTMINGYGEEWQFAQMRTQAIDNMMDAYYDDMFKKSFVDIIKVGKEGAEQFNAAIDSIELNTPFTDNYLSQSFHMVAKTIAARSALGMSRQIFFINYGGWDHHDEVLMAQQEMLTEVDTALGEFNAAMKELNIHNDVLTFSMSEFGRTLTSNGNGTDHAWGGNVFIMGGDVNGQKVYNGYPDLALNSNIEIGGGVLIPSMSVDEYFSEIAMWFGVPSSELTTLFPNIGNFYSPGSGNPIGFLDMV